MSIESILLLFVFGVSLAMGAVALWANGEVQRYRNAIYHHYNERNAVVPPSDRDRELWATVDPTLAPAAPSGKAACTSGCCASKPRKIGGDECRFGVWWEYADDDVLGGRWVVVDQGAPDRESGIIFTAVVHGVVGSSRDDVAYETARNWLAYQYPRHNDPDAYWEGLPVPVSLDYLV